jgi:dTDP-4-amino-4,6-dideoxygalactose transaminase
MSEKQNYLTIAEGLQELKRIVKILESRRNYITRYCSKKKGSQDEIEKQAEFVKAQFKSALDLITRYKDVKTEIQKANLTASFTFNGKKYTLSEAILYKQFLNAQYTALYNSFNTSTAQAHLLIYQRAFGNLTPEQLEKIDMVPELYYDEKQIIKNKEDLIGLMANMDALIDKTNHATTINVLGAADGNTANNTD